MALRRITRLLQPKLVLQDSILALTPDILERHCLKGLVLDVDDTLVPCWDPTVSPEVVSWLQETKKTVNLWLVSNNISQSRIRTIAEQLDLPYLMSAGKPSRRKVRQAVAAMDLPVENIAMVGDRLFTDVMAGNRLGLFTILVEPMVGDRPNYRVWGRSFEFWLYRNLTNLFQMEAKV